MDRFSQRIANLTPKKLALLKRHLEEKREHTGEPAIRPQSRATNIFPLSFAQQRLWFLARLDPDSTAYNEILTVQISGLLNVMALKQSLECLVEQHEILRTSFTLLASQDTAEPKQIISPSATLALPLIDLEKATLVEQQAQSAQIVKQIARQPFDLTKNPLMRTTLIKWSDSKHLLVLSMHHMITDGWSMGIFLRQIGTFYEACSQHGRPSIEPLPIQYADFAVWQHEWLQGEILEKQLAYWKQQLAEAPLMLALPTDRPRPAVQTFDGRREPVSIPPALTNALVALSQREGATLFMILLAAFQTLLYRYTAQEDILVGTAIANRNRKDIEHLIGCFVNTLVMRARISGTMTFLQLLAHVREIALEAYAHQDTPFEKIVEALQPERSLDHNPFFQVMFVLHNAPLGELKIGQLELAVLPTDTNTAKRDLSLALAQEKDGLKGHLEYNSGLFDASTITRLVAHFMNVLNSIVEAPDQRLADIALLSPSELNQLVESWNAPAATYPQPLLIHHLFEAQVERTPDSPAATFEKTRLTYHQLNRKANQLARYLQTLGVSVETLVPIWMERSLDVVVSMLAVLKVGAAYVPLDPMLPEQRIQHLLTEIRAPLLLTQSKLASTLRPGETTMICLDQMQETLSGQGQNNLGNVPVFPNNLAYVIYTSGSTGKPKGVAIAHRQLHQYIEAIINHLKLSPGLNFALLSTFAADLGYTVLFPALVTGGHLHIITQELASDPAVLADYLSRNQIDCIKIIPSHLQALLAYSRAAALIPRYALVVGGEACPWKLIEKIQMLAPHCHIFNHYGPTETTVGALTYCVPRERPASSMGSVPLGYPLTGTSIYVLGPDMEVVPVGVVGQLFIGGVGLARAYLNSPELTAESFVPNPFNTSAEALNTRLYRTGDLGRYREDGTIEFVGRIDQQVKVWGYRIEPAEIEHILRQQPFLQEAFVLPIADARGEKKLVAYLVPDLAAPLVSTDESDTSMLSDQIAQWQMVFEDTYKQITTQIDPTFNLTGWNSSYTGQLIPEAEMQEWLEHTIDRILALQPRNVLEIGCGTGLILFRTAPHVKRYHATDFSAAVIDNLQHVLSQQISLPQVTLAAREANDFTGIEAGTFDTIVLNSVVQYFPSLEFLTDVLEQAVRVLDGKGKIFIGDVRHFGLMEAFHLSVELAHAAPSLPLLQLRQAIYRRISQEQELLIDPAFFASLHQSLPGVGRLHIQLKRGRCQNELVRFRYDVVLEVGSDNSTVEAEDYPHLDWGAAELDIDAIHHLLMEEQLPVLEINHVPNARIVKEILAVELLNEENDLTTVADLQSALQKVDIDGVDPEDFWDLSQKLPYTVEICWSGSGNAGYYDVRFLHRDHQTIALRSSHASSTKSTASLPKMRKSYANDPLRGQFTRRLVSLLRRILLDSLPYYMLPSAFILLDKFTRLPNGKINQKLLPAPDRARTDFERPYVAPRNPIEQVVASIYSQILDLEQISVHDNFFESGGHSLLATQVVTQIHRIFRIDLPLRAMFEAPTVAGLSELLVKHEKQPNQALSIARLRLKINTMSIEQIQEMIRQRKEVRR